MFKIKSLNQSQKNIIVGIILLIIVISLILVAIIPDNKTNKVSSKNIENEEELPEIILNEEIIEYVDITELEQNTVVEENIIENEKTEKENTIDNNSNKNNSDGTPYYIKINYGAQVVTIYKKDAEGNYTIPVKAMVCSTGVATPKSGVYKIQYRWKWLGLQGDVYGQYATQIVGNILFHSVPYLERGNPASLEYWEYDKLGTYASAGCIRLKVSDAIWIFNNCERGTQVEFYSSSDPGPLGKPSAQKISNAPGELKNWDPTDPNSSNPWKNYKPEENKDTDKNISTNINTNTNENIDSNTNITNTNIEDNSQIDNSQEENDKINTEVNENTQVDKENIENNKQENDKPQNEEQDNQENKDNEDNEDNKETKDDEEIKGNEEKVNEII